MDPIRGEFTSNFFSEKIDDGGHFKKRKKRKALSSGVSFSTTTVV
jgi:hypothetical protein